eukprot:6046141-Amphidinium_carterae.1
MTELLQRHKIRAASANETLMKVIANPIDKYLPPGARRFGMSVSGKQVKLRDFTASLEVEDKMGNLPIVFVIGAVAHGDPVTEAQHGLNYVEENISICPWGLSAACCCAKVCTEYEYLWGIC